MDKDEIKIPGGVSLAKRLWGVFRQPWHVEALRIYIGNQEEHHRTETFQDKYRRLLRIYGLEWDERYVWD